MKYGFSEKQLKEIIDIIASYKEVDEAIIFGSRAIDTYKEASDVDIAIKGDKADLSIAGKLKFHFEEETYLPFFFDVVAYKTVESKELKKHIDTKGKSFYSKATREWKKYKIAELCDITRGGSPRPIHDYIQNKGTPWLKIADATSSTSRYISKTKEYIKVEGESKSRVVFSGDLILSNSATPGIPKFMKIRACIHDGWLLLRNFKNIDKLFLYYLLIKEREALLIQGNGSIFTNLKTDILKNHIVMIPEINEQKAIASIISSLDDKIDLLHRQNKTLESMAETLFRQWFIEEANDEWEECKIEKLFKISSGKGLKRKEFDEEGKYPVLGANGIIGKTNQYLFNEKLIFTGRVGTLGHIFIVNENEKVWLSDNTLIIKPYNHFYFIYSLLKTLHLEEYDVGSTQPLIRQSDIKDIEFKISKKSFIVNFEKTVLPIFKKIKYNQEQIIKLEQLRDTLLPKLINGEVKIK